MKNKEKIIIFVGNNVLNCSAFHLSNIFAGDFYHIRDKIKKFLKQEQLLQCQVYFKIIIFYFLRYSKINFHARKKI